MMRTMVTNSGTLERLNAAARTSSALSSLPTTITILPSGLLLGLALLETWNNVG